jgi:hypothetical protein
MRRVGGPHSGASDQTGRGRESCSGGTRMFGVARLVGMLLACLFLVTPSVDALCRASCTPVAAVPPSCHDRVVTPERPHLTSTASCQREVVIAAPTLDGRRTPVAPAPTTAADAPLLPREAAVSGPRRPAGVAAVLSPGCPRSPILRI